VAWPSRASAYRISLCVCTVCVRRVQSQLPPSAKSTWLTSFLFVSLIFNAVCFLELVAVNFGLVAHAWVLEFGGSEREAGAAEHAAAGAAQPLRAVDVLDVETETTEAKSSRKTTAEVEVGQGARTEEETEEETARSGTLRRIREARRALQADAEAVSSGAEWTSPEHQQLNADVETAMEAKPVPRPRLSNHKPSISALAALEEPPDEPVPSTVSATPSVPGSKTRKRMSHVVTRMRRGSLAVARASPPVYSSCNRHCLRAKRRSLRCCANLRRMDHCWRVVFPCAYLPYVLWMLNDVAFGDDVQAMLDDAASLQGCTA